MRRYLLIAGVILGIAQIGSAAPACINRTLSDYVGLGSAGCMIGNNTVGSFMLLNGLNGSTQITPQSITVNPFGTSANPGLTFQTNQSTTPPAILDAMFTYVISGSPFVSALDTMSNTSATGDGAATLITNLCNGTFGPNGVTGCSGPQRTLVVLNNGTDATAFAPWSSIQVTNEFTLDPGLAGSASGGTFSNQFSIPEPATVALTALGLAVAAFRKRLGKEIRG